MTRKLELVLGAGPAGLSVAARRLEENPETHIHLVSEILPDGQSVPGAKEGAHRRAAGIQMPFGGSNPDDPRLRLYMESHPIMMLRAKDPLWPAARECELRTLIDTSSPLPPWKDLVESYRRAERQEIYTTAAFDPRGWVLAEFEDLQRLYPGRFSYDCRKLKAEEVNAVSERRTVNGFDRLHCCIGLEGFSAVLNDGTDFPVLGVLIHLPGDGETVCWMDESTPAGTSGKLDEPDCLYIVRRPLYLGGGNFDPRGRIVLGGTIKPRIGELNDAQLKRVVAAIFEGCEARFGERFDQTAILEVTQGKRPGNENGFQIYVSPEGDFTFIRGQAGMGLVTAYGCGKEINRLLSTRR